MDPRQIKQGDTLYLASVARDPAPVFLGGYVPRVEKLTVTRMTAYSITIRNARGEVCVSGRIGTHHSTLREMERTPTEAVVGYLRRMTRLLEEHLASAKGCEERIRAMQNFNID